MNTKIANAQQTQRNSLDDCIEDVILDRDLERLRSMMLSHQLIKEQNKYSRYKPELVK